MYFLGKYYSLLWARVYSPVTFGIPSFRACAHQKKFGEKMAGEIESEKGHTCIPMEGCTQKAKLACVAESNELQTDSRLGSSGCRSLEATAGCCAHLPAINI